MYGLSVDEIIVHWNEFCEEKGYADDMIYWVGGIEDFAHQLYGSSIPTDCVVSFISLVKDYDGQSYYYWSIDEVIFFDDVEEDGPISWEVFKDWLVENEYIDSEEE